MLEAFAAGDVREGEQEVVLVVVMRGVGGIGLADEVGDLGEQSGTEPGVRWGVGDDVDEVGGLDLRGERELVEVLAGDDGRVFELLDGGGGVVGGAAGGVLWIVAVGGSECSADAPACWDLHGGLHGDVFDRDVGGVEKQLFPLEDGQLRGDTLGDDAIEMGVKRGDALRNGEVELVEIHVVAPPGQRLALCGEDDAGDVVDGRLLVTLGELATARRATSRLGRPSASD